MKTPGPLDFTERITMSVDHIVGKSLQEAASVLAEMDLSFRVVKRDGVDDYVAHKPKSAWRVNLVMESGLVKSYYTG